MKQFLYLDTDIINSIIAQTEKGLVQSLSDEEVSTETETDSLNASIKGTGTIGGSIVKLAKAEANLSGSLESIEGGSLSSTSRQIISKTLHDAAFDIAYAYISPSEIELQSQSNDETGNYVELTRVFDFVATVQFTANKVLRKLLPTSENNLCVIHPIAIYYGR